MKDLIKKLKGAEGPSRELDWLISQELDEIPKHKIKEVGWDYEWFRSSKDFSLKRATDSGGRQIESWTPKPRSSSIDAALTLVPEGYHYGLRYHAADKFGTGWVLSQWKSNPVCSRHETPAIALIIAALRARTTGEGG